VRAPRSLIVVASCVALLGGACSSGGSPVVAPKSERVGTIDFHPCDDVQCATLTVPLDWSHPQGRTISLALARRPASGHRVGVLFVNPGGPGGSGVEFLKAADTVFPAAVRDSFDLVSWDPRGVGDSTPVKCLDNLDSFYAVDHSPDDVAEIQENVALAHQFVDACEQRSGDLLPFMSTAATVRDMDAIRAALGEPMVNYLGFSYGTLLGALYAAKYPTHVRAMVLDGPVDPSLDYTQTIVQQAQSFEADLDAFLIHCKDDGCGFAQGSDPSAAFRQLEQQIDAEPIPADQHRTLGPGEFDIGVASALYGGTSAWRSLAAALSEAARGNGSGLIDFSDQYTERESDGAYSNETAALFATSCLDSPSPPSVAATEKLAATASKAAPVFGASTAWLGLPCTFWPVPPQSKPGPIHAPDAPPIVVVGAFHDPATPYAWAQGLARQLDVGHLLTVDGESHTSYALGDGCVNSAVNDYLLNLTVPAPGARCS
jgi:pimeloyl-ACP methyl ester carboxylesterase